MSPKGCKARSPPPITTPPRSRPPLAARGRYPTPQPGQKPPTPGSLDCMPGPAAEASPWAPLPHRQGPPETRVRLPGRKGPPGTMVKGIKPQGHGLAHHRCAPAGGCGGPRAAAVWGPSRGRKRHRSKSPGGLPAARDTPSYHGPLPPTWKKQRGIVSAGGWPSRAVKGTGFL